MKTLKKHGNKPKTMKNHETLLKKKPCKPTKNHETMLKNHGNQQKAMKNHENTLKNHKNQPKIMKLP